MSRHALLFQKLRELDRYVTELERLRSYSFEEIASNLSLLWAVEHGLQLSIQILIDIGSHLLTTLGEQEAEDYTEVIEKLGARRVIPQKFALMIRGMAGFHNLLVHEYAEVDLQEVY